MSRTRIRAVHKGVWEADRSRLVPLGTPQGTVHSRVEGQTKGPRQRGQTDTMCTHPVARSPQLTGRPSLGSARMPGGRALVGDKAVLSICLSVPDSTYNLARFNRASEAAYVRDSVR